MAFTLKQKKMIPVARFKVPSVKPPAAPAPPALPQEDMTLGQAAKKVRKTAYGEVIGKRRG